MSRGCETMKYVIGIDLGTSSVKILLINQNGDIIQELSKPYPLIQKWPGYSEQDPEQWVEKTRQGLKELMNYFNGNPKDIEGISFSGQMHGLVLLDENNNVLRNAILWNDTRTTKQCEYIIERIGKKSLYQLVKNPPLEGFTLPKLLWVKEHEPDIFSRIKTFLLPKDYLRYRMTGIISTDYSDAAGTLLLDIKNKRWSIEICKAFDIDPAICPPLVESAECVGYLNEDFAKSTGLSSHSKVFAGGADNACGAIGAGITSTGKTMCSIGTSGVILSYEWDAVPEYDGNIHFFNHAVKDAYYSMGVTLSAGYSLEWFRKRFAPDLDFDELIEEAKQVDIGSKGLIFSPYLVGERTPHADSVIRASFLGIDAVHQRSHFTRAIIEGITFSLNESIDILRKNGRTIDTIVSIGGGAKNDFWLQMQADIFNAKIIKLKSEQGPAMGAAMIAAYGSHWFSSLDEAFKSLNTEASVFYPIMRNTEKYQTLFSIYQTIYSKTEKINRLLKAYR
jgi:xylulokinase